MKIDKIRPEYLIERTKWLNTPLIFNQMYFDNFITIEDTESWYKRISENKTRLDLVFIENEEIVAMTGLTNINFTDQNAEFYIMVNPQLQGKGYGKKSTELTLNYGFLNFNLFKIYLYANSENTSANKLYYKLGFHLEGTLRKHRFKNGKLIDRNIYGILKEEWAQTDYSTLSIDSLF